MLCTCGHLLGQNNLNSPYSRFGLGDVVNPEFVPLRSMGGISTAFAHPYYTNLSNPASLGALQATAFEIGFDAARVKLKTDESELINWSGNLNYFSLAFPLINPVNRLLDRRKTDFNWGMSLSLTPVTRVNHFTVVNEEIAELGPIIREYRGAGGTNMFSWGNGIKYKNFHFGLNLGYLFGSIMDEKTVLFGNQTALHDYVLRDASYRGFTWKGGLQYEIDLSGGAGAEDERNAESITLGLTGNGRWNLRALTTVLDARMSSTYGGLQTVANGVVRVDTLLFDDEARVEGKLPATFSLGVVYKKSTRWLLGANYTYTGWAKYQNDLHQNQTFANTSYLGVGVQYVPDATAFKYYYQRIRYRAGLRFGADPRVIEGEQIKDFNVSLGLGLPVVLSRQLSFINLGVEFSRHGGQIPLTENFVRFNLGVTLNNNLWFLKRKFN